MTENDLLEMLAPIKKYILENDVKRNDIKVIVLNNMPSEERLLLIADYFKANLPEFKIIKPEQILERTRIVLESALESSALAILANKPSEIVDSFTDEDIENELADYLWDDEYDYSDLPHED